MAKWNWGGEENQGVGASASPKPALVSDQAPAGLDPSGFDPARWQASRFYRLLRGLEADGGELGLRAAVAIDALAETLEGMCYQFAGQTSCNGAAAIWTMGLSDLEGSFDILGWSDPHPTPEVTCDEPGCDQWSTCGTPTPEGYRRTCGKHCPNSDSGRLPKGEDAPAAECEASQSGAVKQAHRPENPAYFWLGIQAEGRE